MDYNRFPNYFLSREPVCKKREKRVAPAPKERWEIACVCGMRAVLGIVVTPCMSKYVLTVSGAGIACMNVKGKNICAIHEVTGKAVGA